MLIEWLLENLESKGMASHTQFIHALYGDNFTPT